MGVGCATFAAIGVALLFFSQRSVTIPSILLAAAIALAVEHAVGVDSVGFGMEWWNDMRNEHTRDGTAKRFDIPGALDTLSASARVAFGGCGAAEGPVEVAVEGVWCAMRVTSSVVYELVTLVRGTGGREGAGPDTGATGQL